MANIYADITLINAGDVAIAKRNLISQDEIKGATIKMQVGTGAYWMAINESIRDQLQLYVEDQRIIRMPNGVATRYNIAGPIEVRFKNRRCCIDAIVLPGDTQAILGSMPMNDMDILIDPLRQELIVNPDHPYFAQMKMK